MKKRRPGAFADSLDEKKTQRSTERERQEERYSLSSKTSQPPQPSTHPPRSDDQVDDQDLSWARRLLSGGLRSSQETFGEESVRGRPTKTTSRSDGYERKRICGQLGKEDEVVTRKRVNELFEKVSILITRC